MMAESRAGPSARGLWALGLAIVAVLSADAVAVVRAPSDAKATCVQVRFPEDASPDEEFAFAWGVMHATGDIESAYSGVRSVLVLKLRRSPDAEDLSGRLDGLPLLATGLGASTTSVLDSSVVDCAAVENEFGNCEQTPGRVRCTPPR